jgi:tetratricopeptide (TPR) repeat protein
MARRQEWVVVVAVGLLAVGLAACGGPALTPLQLQYQREEERAQRYHARGELPRALAAYQESLRWAEIADDRPAMATQALNVGALALALGDWELAERSFQQARRTAAALSDRTGELRARLGLAQASLRQGRFQAARSAFEQVLNDARDRDAAVAVVALNGLGLARQELEQTQAARVALAEAESLARAHGDRRLLAATLANQAALALRVAEVDPAAQYLKEAIDLDRAAENLPGLAHDLLLLARVRQRQGETPAALELERQARTILRHTGQSGQLDRRDGEENFVERESGVRLQPVWLKSEERDGVSE